jgi:hypothetical protein
MSFEDVLNSEHKYLVEGIEHGSSDPEVLQSYVDRLRAATGYVYQLSDRQAGRLKYYPPVKVKDLGILSREQLAAAIKASVLINKHLTLKHSPVQKAGLFQFLAQSCGEHVIPNVLLGTSLYTSGIETKGSPLYGESRTVGHSEAGC